MTKEAKARIKINKLLEEAGWRFFDDANGQANIALEPNVKITTQQVDALGEDFQSKSNGYVDFLLLDSKGFPFVVLEAKAEKYSPLVGKEQARTYAKSLNCRFVILSNGNLHYFWDLENGKFDYPAALAEKELLPVFEREPHQFMLVAQVFPLAMTHFRRELQAMGFDARSLPLGL